MYRHTAETPCDSLHPLPTAWLLPVLFTILLTAIQLTRVVTFVNVYGGLEHDSGWMLGIARSLAEQGTYASMFSTIEDPTVRAGVGVDGRFSIQGDDGRLWFLTSGVGVASIVPDAIILKIFGYSFWALRAGPLLFYTLFLLLAAYTMYRLAGLWSIVLFHAILFCYPHLSIFLGYEAMGEVPAMFYTLWAYLAFATAAQKTQRRSLWFLGAGVVAGLAVNTKLLAVLSVSSIFMWAGLSWLSSITKRRATPGLNTGLLLKDVLCLAAGAGAVQVAWLLTVMIALTRFAGFELYRRNVQQWIKVFLNEGSGVSTKLHSGPEFIWRKLMVLQEVAHPTTWVTCLLFVGILFGGAAVLWLWRGQDRRNQRNLLAPLWLGWLANTAWFVGVAMGIAPRHYWFGLILASLLLSTIPVVLILQAMERLNFGDGVLKKEPTQPSYLSGYILLATGTLMLALVVWSFASQKHVWGLTLPEEIVDYWKNKELSHVYDAAVPWIIVPRADQQEVVDYINHMPPQARVYYPAGRKAAEIPPQTGRIHYPLNRRSFPGATPHPADVLIINPSVISAWRYDTVQHQDLLSLVERTCPLPVVKNDSYVLCLVDQLSRAE